MCNHIHNQGFWYLRYLETLCVHGSPMVPLVGNIFTICTNLITNGTIGNEIGAYGKNVLFFKCHWCKSFKCYNQWYHWENPEHMHCL